MLEKSRVVQRGEGDKNFHIFYYFLADLPEEKRQAFYLSDPEQYRYISIDDVTPM
jgi:myosin heavy subunit